MVWPWARNRRFPSSDTFGRFVLFVMKASTVVWQPAGRRYPAPVGRVEPVASARRTDPELHRGHRSSGADARWTELDTNVWRPVGAGRWPTLLVRLPNGKDRPSLFTHGTSPNVFALVQAGYAVVFQDCRGSFRSDGPLNGIIHHLSMRQDA